METEQWLGGVPDLHVAPPLPQGAVLWHVTYPIRRGHEQAFCNHIREVLAASSREKLCLEASVMSPAPGQASCFLTFRSQAELEAFKELLSEQLAPVTAGQPLNDTCGVIAKEISRGMVAAGQFVRTAHVTLKDDLGEEAAKLIDRAFNTFCVYSEGLVRAFFVEPSPNSRFWVFAFDSEEGYDGCDHKGPSMELLRNVLPALSAPPEKPKTGTVLDAWLESKPFTIPGFTPEAGKKRKKKNHQVSSAKLIQSDFC